MSRRHRADKREVNPDPKFGEVVITKFMNAVMSQGKKSVAERIVYGAFERMENKAKSNPVQLFHQALSTPFTADRVVLFESTPGPGGSVFTTLHEAPLRG